MNGCRLISQIRVLYSERLIHLPATNDRSQKMKECKHCSHSFQSKTLFYGWYNTRTASQSSEKSREVELATSVMRTRKFAFVKSLLDHKRPHVSAAPPSR